MPHWLSIRRVGGRADAQERSPVPLSDASEDLTDFALDEDSPADECSQNSSAHGQDDGDSDSDEHGGSDSAGKTCLLYTSPSPRDPKTSRMPSSA